MNKLTPEQVEWACSKRETGWSTNAIGQRLGVSAGAINYQCLKHGAVSPRQRRTETPSERMTYQGRDGRTFRTFTPDDDQQLLELATSGKTISAIGRMIGRGNTSVRMRLMLLAIREDLPVAEKAA